MLFLSLFLSLDQKLKVGIDDGVKVIVDESIGFTQIRFAARDIFQMIESVDIAPNVEDLFVILLHLLVVALALRHHSFHHNRLRLCVQVSVSGGLGGTTVCFASLQLPSRLVNTSQQPSYPLRSLPANTLHIGPSGSGKSVALIRTLIDRDTLGGCFDA